jgi:hypothetical protein
MICQTKQSSLKNWKNLDRKSVAFLNSWLDLENLKRRLQNHGQHLKENLIFLPICGAPKRRNAALPLIVNWKDPFSLNNQTD